MLPATYLLPFRVERDDASIEELAAYVRALAAYVDDVLVVDGSPPPLIEHHREKFGARVRVVTPDVVTLMGKVGNVITGVHRARHEHVVIADDDVRYRREELERVVAALDGAEVVRPQNYFEPLPWHARFDTARTLLNRLGGGDWPGTLAVRRSAFIAANAYDGRAMFENLELVRTIRAAGGRDALLLDVLVERRPPSSAHFRGQQVRQAYDEFARPARLVASLLAAPLLVFALVRGRRDCVFVGAAMVVGAAEAGRRRAGGATRYPASSVWLAPVWVVWRSLATWAALGARLRGGVSYRGVRIARAANSERTLRARQRAAVRRHASYAPPTCQRTTTA